MQTGREVMKNLKSIWLGVISLSFTTSTQSVANAKPTLQPIQAYSYDSLKNFWDSLLSQNSIPAEWYENTLIDGTTIVQIVEAGESVKKDSNLKAKQTRGYSSSSWGDEDEDEDDIGTPAPPPVNEPPQDKVDFPKDRRFYFNIKPLPSNKAAQLRQRQLALTLFINKARFYINKLDFDQEGEDSTENLSKKLNIEERWVSKKVLSANIELFLLNLLQYRAEPNLKGKCQALQLAKESKREIDILQGVFLSDMTVQPWLATLNQIHTSFKKELKQEFACLTTRTSNRVEQLKQVEGALEEHIINSLEEQQNSTVSAINAKKIEADEVKQKTIEIDSHAGAVIELERRLQNTFSNMDLLKKDTLKVKEKVKKVSLEVKLQEIQSLGQSQLQPITDVIAANEKIKDSANTYLRKMVELGNKWNLSACSNLHPNLLEERLDSIINCIDSMQLKVKNLSSKSDTAKQNPIVGQEVENVTKEVLKMRMEQ